METRKSLSLYLSQHAPQLRGHHRVGGANATASNRIQIDAFCIAWYYLASDLLVQEGIWGRSLEVRLERFHNVLKTEDLLLLLNISQSCTDCLLGGNLDELCWDDFKQHLNALYPAKTEVIGGLLAPITPVLNLILGSGDFTPGCLKSVLQFFRFGRKLHLESIGLEEISLDLYLDCEDRISKLDLGSDPTLIIELNKIMRKWLRRLDLRDLSPKHGSGSVAEGKLTLYDKYKSLSSDLKLAIVTDHSTSSYYDVARQHERHTDLPSEGSKLSRISRTIFVPKTFSKLRTISMEPTTLMFWQQAIMGKLYEYFKYHPHLRWCVQLEDQEYNRRMAQRGSRDNSLATIDLSAASDSVSWSLVKAVFARTPLLKWLYATRSNKTLLPNGNVIELAKFAPMGSALCFPIQCLIFAACVEYVTQRCKQQISEIPGYAVYGDDIIVAKDCVPELMRVLNALGFQVNQDKTFVDGKFRESCGGDYYDGIDVSSVYYKFQIKHRFNSDISKRMSPNCYAAIASVINLCYKQGLKHLREYFLRFALKYYPYFTDNPDRDPDLLSAQPTNFHVKARWHDDYQEWVGRFVTVLSTPVQRCFEDEDDISYLCRLGQMATLPSVSKSTQDVVDIALHGAVVRLGRQDREVIVTSSSTER